MTVGGLRGRRESRSGQSARSGVRWARRLLVVAMAGTVPVWYPASGTLASAAPAAAGTHAGAVPQLAPAALSAAAPVALVAAAPAAPVAPDASGKLPEGWVNTQWGPYGPADVAFLQNVRRANLWEGEDAAPMGQKKGDSERVREVGKLLEEQHAVLETKLREVAGKLGVSLPTEPNADQKSWLAEMNAASGPAFDRVWVERLRAAHGVIYSLIATVRANTRNSMVRAYAEAGNTAVTTHMGLLESTGLVEYNTLPTPASPPPKAAAAAPQRAQADAGGGPLIRPASSTSGGLNPMVIWLVLIAALCAGGVVAVRVFRPR